MRQIEKYPQSRPAEPEAMMSRASKILIVDDDSKICNTIRKCLTNAGFSDLTTAGTGEDALAKLRSSQFELALLDVYLPVPNGLEILRQIQQRRMPTEVVMISGMAATKEVDEALQLGARHFLEKPLDLNILRGLVQQLLEEAREDPIVAYVRRHCHEIRSREEVARTFRVHSDTINNHISNATGQCFSAFLRHCRIERARELLETTGLTIKQIAYRVGFCSPELFSRIFKNTVQLSPTQYRLRKGFQRERP